MIAELLGIPDGDRSDFRRWSDATIEATDKPHGLREAYILDPDGYCWVPGRPKV